MPKKILYADNMAHCHLRHKEELDKFKRRLIRTIARLLITEKRPEDEIREALKKETGCDCRNIWMRMKALTMKKLQRLLDVDDKLDALPGVAQMSTTDWLLVDLVLVHQGDIDFIGKERNDDRPAMVYLNELVEEFEIEMTHGEELANAWIQIAKKYNQSGRTCSPMLLQRRWYQLKEQARESFYKFWFSYRGSSARLTDAIKPSPLMTAIAKRNKQVVTCQFVAWEELIEQKCVIMPDQFEDIKKGIPRKSPPVTVKKKEEEPPDLVMIEPDIETIDLGDSDKEENDTESQSTSIVEFTPTEVKIKEEPLDIDIEEETFLLNTAEKKSIHEEVLEALELEDPMIDENPLVSNINNNPTQNLDTLINNNNIVVSTINNTIALENDDDVEIVNDDIGPVNHVTLPKHNDDVVPVVDDKTIPFTDENEPVSDDIISVENYGTNITENTTVTEESDISLVDDGTSAVDNSIENPNTVLQEPQEVLPQITNIFGNVNVSNETLGKLAAIAQIRENAESIEKPEYDAMIPIPLIKDDIEEEFNSDNDIVQLKETIKFEIEENIVHIKQENTVKANENQFSIGNLSNDIHFGDEGIELLDDGIAFDDDDEEEIRSDPITNAIKAVLEKAVDHVDDTPKIDKKLLLCPVVYTLRLEQMGLHYITSFQHVEDKLLLEMISAKSKPPRDEIIEAESVDRDNCVVESIELQGDDALESIKQKGGLLHKVMKQEKVDTELINQDQVDRVAIFQEEDHVTDQEESEEEQIRRVKLSSYLLQKPRSRQYNPILLCKNPDFNTRLKRLNFGFFGYPNNRALLEACKPLTIDVSKTFETKLIDGTMYLDTGDLQQNIKIEVDNYIDIQKGSIIPSEISAPIVEGNTVGENQSAVQTSLTHHIPIGEGPIACERNKVINLPDISQVRLINQSLLTAEVTPIQITNNTQLPVAIVPKTIEKNPEVDEQTQINKDENKEKTFRAIIERTENEKQPVFTCTKQQPFNNTLGINSTKRIGRPSNKLVPKKPQPKLVKSSKVAKVVVPWIQRSNLPIQSKDDTLLTMDTLNKMLFLLTTSEEDNAAALLYKQTQKQKGKKKRNNKSSQVTNANQATQVSMEECTDVVQVTKEKKITPKIKILSGYKKSATRRLLEKEMMSQKYCCWARRRVIDLKASRLTRALHDCPFTCVCCCKQVLQQYITNEYEANFNNKMEMVDEKTRSEYIHKRIEGHAIGCKSCSSANVTIENEFPIEMNVESEIEIGTDHSSIHPSQLVNTNNYASTSPVVTIDLDVDDPKVASVQDETLEPIAVDADISTAEDSVTEGPSSRLNSLIINNESLESAPTTAVIENVQVSSLEAKASTPDMSNIVVETPATIVRNYNSVQVSENEVPTTGSTPRDINDSTPSINFDVTSIAEPILNVTDSNKEKNSNLPLNRQQLSNDPSKNAIRLNNTDDNVATMRVYTQPKPKTSTVCRGAMNSKLKTYSKLPNPKEQHLHQNSRNQPLKKMVKIQKPSPPPKIMLSNSSKEKVIYLNKRRLNKNKPDLPIYLGPNKILLTTVQFPRMLKQLELAQTNQGSAPPICLPKGVTLSLLPTGKVIFTLDPHTSVDPHEMALLPDIIALIQKQINETGLPQNVLPVNKIIPLQRTVAPVINLDDTYENVTASITNPTIFEEIKDHSQSNCQPTSIANYELNNVIENAHVENSSDVSNAVVEHVSNIVSNEDGVGDIVTGPEKETTKVPEMPTQNIVADADTQLSNKTTSDIEQPEKLNEDISEENNSEDTTKQAEVPNPDTNLKTLENVASEPKSLSKNILSDLMEMSGISEEDFVEQAPQNDTAGNPYLTVSPLVQDTLPQQASILSQFISSETDEEQVEDFWPTIETPCGKLSPVTSLIELKYAYANNGTFYKLDFEKGYLLPINVCIKQKPKHLPKLPPLIKCSLPKTVIDLTDDDNVPDESPTQSTSTTGDPETPKTLINNHTDLGEGRSLLIENQKVKPVKLFKTIFPNILRAQLKERYKEVFDRRFHNKGNSSLKSGNKERRKQNIETTINFNRPDNLESENTIMTVDCDDSDDSDDEPLSKKAKRMRGEEMSEQVPKQVNIEKNNEQIEDGIRNKEFEMNIENTEPSSLAVNAGHEIVDGTKGSNMDDCNIMKENSVNLTENVDMDANIPLIEERLEFRDENDDEEEGCILGI